MTQNKGGNSGSRASTEPSGLGPSGFDPGRSPVGAEDYAQGLLGEEASEVGQALGKARRFGIDTPGPQAAPYFGCTAREMLETECGDMLAAIEWAIGAGLIRRHVVIGQRNRKLTKLMDPNSVDNLGRRLAPAIATEARRAATVKQGAVHEGAGLQGIAQHRGG